MALRASVRSHTRRIGSENLVKIAQHAKTTHVVIGVVLFGVGLLSVRTALLNQILPKCSDMDCRGLDLRIVSRWAFVLILLAASWFAFKMTQYATLRSDHFCWVSLLSDRLAYRPHRHHHAS
jgi:hypothetical protein